MHSAHCQWPFLTLTCFSHFAEQCLLGAFTSVFLGQLANKISYTHPLWCTLPSAVDNYWPWSFSHLAEDCLVCWEWSGVAKVTCILCHRGIQLILANSWARLAILVAGRGRGECFYFFCFFPFIPVSLSSLSVSFISSTFSSISFLPFWKTTQNDPQGVMCR